MHTFFITPGEFNGIGLEVTLKCLPKLNSSKNRFIIWTDKNYLANNYENKELNFFSSFNDIPLKPSVYFLDSKLSPAQWFKESVEICKVNPNNYGIITGPLEKKSFEDINSLGHTEYLRKSFPDNKLFMTFFGSVYNCMLLTDHCPLNAVSNNITKKLVTDSLTEARKLSLKLNFLKPTILLGLNPHAGENGLLGSEEVQIHSKAIKEGSFKDIIGPVSPDGFFGIESYRKYSLLIANYHDQGLIPFKAINGFDAAQASLGLPFIRTSVDHGTAFDIFGKNQADPKSMLRAISLAEELL